MVKVYFDILHAGELTRDLEGEDFPDLTAAKKDAEASLHEMVGDAVMYKKPLEPVCIIMRNEQGQEIATVQMHAAVKMDQVTEN